MREKVLRASLRSAPPALLALLVLSQAGQAQLPGEGLRPLHWQPPLYTYAAWGARIAGREQVTLSIDPSGRVTDATLNRRLPMGLDKAVLTAAEAWVFAPDIQPERQVTITVEFAVDPADAWDDGVEWSPNGVLRVWRVHARHRLNRGLNEGSPLPLTSPDALAALTAVVRLRAERAGPPQLVSIGGREPDRAFMEQFNDLHGRVARTGPAANGAEAIKVERVSASPRGPVIVEISSQVLRQNVVDLYAVERLDDRWLVVEEDYESRPIS